MKLYCHRYPTCNKNEKKSAVFYDNLSLRCFYLTSEYNSYQMEKNVCGADDIVYKLTEFEKDMLLAISRGKHESK